MPLIKELEDLMPLLGEMDKYSQKRAAQELRDLVMIDEGYRTMTFKENAKKMPADIDHVIAERKMRL